MEHESILVQRLVKDEKRVAFAPNDTFLRSYPEFLRYFQSIPRIETHHLIIAAHFTYGWMPTMFRFKSNEFGAGTEVLNRAKQGHMVGEDELRCLASLINNSLVGSSKLLHFANPAIYGIWDSRVYRYLYGGVSVSQLIKPKNYLKYLKICQTVLEDNSFSGIHNSMNSKVGYAVTPMRAIELIMFMTGVRNGVSEINPETLG